MPGKGAQRAPEAKRRDVMVVSWKRILSVGIAREMSVDDILQMAEARQG